MFEVPFAFVLVRTKYILGIWFDFRWSSRAYLKQRSSAFYHARCASVFLIAIDFFLLAVIGIDLFLLVFFALAVGRIFGLLAILIIPFNTSYAMLVLFQGFFFDFFCETEY